MEMGQHQNRCCPSRSVDDRSCRLVVLSSIGIKNPHSRYNRLLAGGERLGSELPALQTSEKVVLGYKLDIGDEIGCNVLLVVKGWRSYNRHIRLWIENFHRPVQHGGHLL